MDKIINCCCEVSYMLAQLEIVRRRYKRNVDITGDDSMVELNKLTKRNFILEKENMELKIMFEKQKLKQNNY